MIQETLGWNDATGVTTGQRSKEEAKDYRYMPEPDLPPIHLSADFIADESAKLPLMPADYRVKFGEIIKPDILEILLDDPELMLTLDKISALTSLGSHPAGVDESSSSSVVTSECSEKALILAANLFASVLLAEEKSAEYLNDLPSAQQLADLAGMNEKKELSSTATKEVFLKMFDPEMHMRDAKTIAKELGVIQENDLGALEAIVDAVLAKPEAKKAQEDFRAGSEKVLGFLVGQVMKESHGKANPSAVQEILRKKLA